MARLAAWNIEWAAPLDAAKRDAPILGSAEQSGCRLAVDVFLEAARPDEGLRSQESRSYGSSAALLPWFGEAPGIVKFAIARAGFS
jgi:hypothetical protein